MNASGQRLHALIKSLSQKEKRFIIHSFSNRGKRKSIWYKKLYLIYESMDQYDDQEMDLELQNQDFPPHIHVLKNQLFNWILGQMHTFHHQQKTNFWEHMETLFWMAKYLKKKICPKQGVAC